LTEKGQVLVVENTRIEDSGNFSCIVGLDGIKISKQFQVSFRTLPPDSDF
jgi:hypothetical protein